MLESDSPPLEIASSVLEARFGTRPKLAIEERFVTGKSISARCRVTGLADIDAVFVKHLPPEKQSDQTLNDFLWEIASYQAISQIPEAIQITPAFFGFDREERCLVLEDLGAPAGPNTADLLQGSDPDAAMEALLEGVRLLGRFHGACASIALKMSSIRAELGPSVPVRHPFEDPWPRVGFVASSEVEVSRAVAEYRDVCLFLRSYACPWRGR